MRCEPHHQGETDYEVCIAVNDARWRSALPELDALSRRVINAGLQHIHPRPFAELSLAFLNDADVQKLNYTYRRKNQPTNVLSFPAQSIGGFTPLLGDVVLALESISREAMTRGISFSDHLAHLLIHGLYHLQGYDHKTAKDAKIMETLEIKALAGLGISNPYDKEDIL